MHLPGKNNKEFQKMKDHLGEDLAYHLWDKNGGHPLTLTPKGEHSKLFDSLMDQLGNEKATYEAKSKIYTNAFRQKYGDWMESGEEPMFNIHDEDKQSLAKGGKIEGVGTGKSDSISATLPEGAFIVPIEHSESAENLGRSLLGWNDDEVLKRKHLKEGGTVDAKVSNGEVMFTPEEVSVLRYHGVDLNQLAPKAENKIEMKKGGFAKRKMKFSRAKINRPLLVKSLQTGGPVKDNIMPADKTMVNTMKNDLPLQTRLADYYASWGSGPRRPSDRARYVLSKTLTPEQIKTEAEATLKRRLTPLHHFQKGGQTKDNLQPIDKTKVSPTDDNRTIEDKIKAKYVNYGHGPFRARAEIKKKLSETLSSEQIKNIAGTDTVKKVFKYKEGGLLNALKKGGMTRKKKSKLSKEKAAEILHDGTAHGKPLTKKQRGFFAIKAGYQEGGKVTGDWRHDSQQDLVISDSKHTAYDKSGAEYAFNVDQNKYVKLSGGTPDGINMYDSVVNTGKKKSKWWDNVPELMGAIQTAGGTYGLMQAGRRPDLHVSSTLNRLSGEVHRLAQYGYEPSVLNALNTEIENTRRNISRGISLEGGQGSMEQMAKLSNLLSTTIDKKAGLLYADAAEKARKWADVMKIDSEKAGQEFDIQKLNLESWYKNQDVMANLFATGISNIIGARQLKTEQDVLKQIGTANPAWSK